MDFIEYRKKRDFSQLYFGKLNTSEVAYLNLDILEQCIFLGDRELSLAQECPHLDNTFLERLASCCGLRPSDDATSFLYFAKWVHALRPIQILPGKRLKPPVHLHFNDVHALDLGFFGMDPEAGFKLNINEFHALAKALHVRGFSEVVLREMVRMVEATQTRF